MGEALSLARPILSVVIPTRNEAANAEQIAKAVIAEMEGVGEPFDIIFIDNASEDSTAEILRGVCARDPRVRLIINARDFGQMRSPTHGIFQARGQAVIAMCADFQDPPALIPGLVARWRQGADIVLGVRKTEKSSWSLSLTRSLAYRFARAFGDYPIVSNATGFGLYDRKVVDTLAQLREPEPFFRGMLVETGHRIDLIPYARPERAGGQSKNNFFALLDFALSSLSGTSKKLVRVPFYLGVISLGLFLLTLIGALVSRILGHSWGGWVLASLVELNFSMLFTFLGILGDQVRLITERTRRTPLVIERERVNFPVGY